MPRHNVSVTAVFTKEGGVRPINVLWDDGRVFTIEKITGQGRAASLKSGGAGDRYTCFIRGKEVYLFNDSNKWFVERTENA